MFNKILIANRGEIACRIMETARDLGVATVAVYSDADANSRHVEMADQSVHIGGSAPADSYLRGDVIIRAALDTGAQAIHPGYGFLSENPDFVDAVASAGLVFIGPSASAIRAMGLKDAAKALMEKSGVPVVPGYHGSNQNAKFLSQAAEKIGFPVLIKAVAGGGGKGMRLVEQAGEFTAALASAQSEATSAFGNSDVLIEKFVEKPRHIEIQVFGDGQNVVHLFERDCSLQRRHQKVIEEAPAPGMTPEMRQAMCDAAVRAAQAINYKGAGTVEFIVDGSDGLHPDRFWFMEMNTRLQVEHPVTEAVTGVDLVEWQLRVGAGEPLPKNQAELHLNGHAFEARLYAEDAENGFLPVSGRLDHLQFSVDARNDTGVRPGDEVSPFYDPMIAKITTHGATREVALSKLSAALLATEVAGTITNLIFLGRLARHSGFAKGQVDTGLIARNIGTLTGGYAPGDDAIALAVMAASGVGSGDEWATGFSLWEPLEWQIDLTRGQESFRGLVTLPKPGAARVRVGEETVELEFRNDQWQLLGEAPKVWAKRIGQGVTVFGQTSWDFTIPDPLAVVGDTVVAGNIIEAPMPGVIRSFAAKPGQSVSMGDRLVVLEAMKMEHVLAAPRDGIIEEVFVAVDDQVVIGAPLIALQENDEGSADA